MNVDIDALKAKHWLKFDRLVITGCQCGFKANTDSDCGFGDSVANHLMEVGIEAAGGRAIRLCPRCTTEVLCDQCGTCLYHCFCDGGAS